MQLVNKVHPNPILIMHGLTLVRLDLESVLGGGSSTRVPCKGRLTEQAHEECGSPVATDGEVRKAGVEGVSRGL